MRGLASARAKFLIAACCVSRRPLNALRGGGLVWPEQELETWHSAAARAHMLILSEMSERVLCAPAHGTRFAVDGPGRGPARRGPGRSGGDRLYSHCCDPFSGLSLSFCVLPFISLLSLASPWFRAGQPRTMPCCESLRRRHPRWLIKTRCEYPRHRHLVSFGSPSVGNGA